MIKIDPQLKFFILLAKAQAVVGRKFDARLSHGLSLNDFSILYHLSQDPEERMRRVDLAEKMGLTASGVTRLLLPMEKIGLVKREAHAQDGRVSYVKLSRAGKEFLTEAAERAELVAEEILAAAKGKRISDLSSALDALSS